MQGRDSTRSHWRIDQGLSMRKVDVGEIELGNYEHPEEWISHRRSSKESCSYASAATTEKQ